ncbi:MAG: cupin domain-containing protein [Chitinophagaceae bacterium]|nr:MAG: cupin domain-containing protein [Chitinophagaceae bacterium]
MTVQAFTRPHVKLAAADIPAVVTSHNSGSKLVFSKGFDQPVLIKQIAIGRLEPGESIEPHVHPDMDEHYFILQGTGTMRINKDNYSLKSGDFILVTAGSEHELHCENNRLEFYYQGFEILSAEKTSQMFKG